MFQEMNIADEILESLKDKHKPVDSALLEEQQKQHQLIPPRNQDEDEEDNDKVGWWIFS